MGAPRGNQNAAGPHKRTGSALSLAKKHKTNIFKDPYKDESYSHFVSRMKAKGKSGPGKPLKKPRKKSSPYAHRGSGAVGNLRLKKYRKGSGYVQFD